jgi:hypothetical protein
VRSTRELLKTGADTALPTVRLTRRVRRLEEGVRENALLAEPLEELVAAIEQSLVPRLEAAHESAQEQAQEQAERRRRG